MSKEAMKQALEALEYAASCVQSNYMPDKGGHDWDEVMDTLRTAIEQAEKQEPHSWYSAEHDEWMTDKTRKEHERLNSYTHKVGGFDLPLYTTPPAAPVQEPVAVVSGYYGGQCVVLPTDPARLFNSGTAFYTTPPAAQRQWVGLTAGERDALFTKHYQWDDYGKAIEAKLREKNA